MQKQTSDLISHILKTVIMLSSKCLFKRKQWERNQHMYFINAPLERLIMQRITV